MAEAEDVQTLALLPRSRRSIQDCSDREVPADLNGAILDDERWAPN